MTAQSGDADTGATQRSRRWGSTPRTRASILDAAEYVFHERGFTDASISDIVERSGVSVGSIYHHFGGKSEIFLALWEQRQMSSLSASSDAVAAARTAGQHDPTELFLVGARAYLESTWELRHLVRAFTVDAGPPGFDSLRRTNWRSWIRQNTTLLGATDEPASRILVSAVTSIMVEGAREVVLLDSPAEAHAVIDMTLSYAARLLGD